MKKSHSRCALKYLSIFRIYTEHRPYTDYELEVSCFTSENTFRNVLSDEIFVFI